jgi:alpha-tubulin suppressor-like RCC1 family protein
MLLGNNIIAQGNKAAARIRIDNSVVVFSGANTNSSFVVREGLLLSCGDNSFGQLGLGNEINTISHSRQVGSENDWILLSAGSFHTVAVKKDGTLWGWGDNEYGQAGTGTKDKQPVPVQISADNNWESIACSDYQSFAIKKDGSLWAWGVNNYGQLGTGTVSSFVNTPQQVGNAHDWKAVSAGSFHTLALKKDGSLWAWGYGADGQLGLGSGSSFSSPVQVGESHDWSMISAAGFHSIALRRDGTCWSWGDNEYGVLGNGNTEKQFTPVAVSGTAKWKMVTAGFHHTAAIRSDGTLWVWGNNFSGELGLGFAGGEESKPVQIGNEKNWQYITSGFAHTLALKKDGTRWAWGQNEYGQLGCGDFTNKTSPEKQAEQ